MAAPMNSHVESKSTLFVRNLPFTTTKEQLEGVFSEVGPIKKSFVVTEKGVKDRCRGFGYVTFALREDAEKAIKARLMLDNRRLFLSYSRRKEPRNKGRTKRDQTEEEKADEVKTSDDIGKTSVEAGKRAPGGRKVKPDTTAKTVDPIKRRRDADKDWTKREKKQKTGQGDTASKEGRLIIRNLAFSCSEERLGKAFARFGDITEVHIPSDPTDLSKVRGYGFVQFSAVASASKAVEEMNTKKIMGRPIAVDWALSREKYLAATKTNLTGKRKPQETDEVEDSDDEDDDGSDESGMESSSELEETREGGGTDEEADSDSNHDDDDDADGDDSDGEMEEDSDSEDEGVASNEDGKRKRPHQNIEQESEATKRKKISDDVGEGRTVFIRNILFETTEEEIRELFSEFGQVMYSKLVVDPTTEHSKGTAFVQFATKESVDRCLEKASNVNQGTEGLVLGGRRLLVSLALPRDQASKLREIKKEKQKILKKDKRNMYLLQEGFIRPGTSAAQGMTDSDVAKRTKLETIKRLKLKNINIFVSPTRLSIHNLPKAVDDKTLKKALLTAASDKKAKVIESRVMRDMKNPTSESQSKSLGFAFAEFTQHEHALAALRKMNNSTEFFGSKRPIVGFSLENRLALEARQRRREKSLLKARQIQSMQKLTNREERVKKGKQPAQKRATQPGGKPKKGVAPAPPSSKLEQRLQAKSKMTVHVGAKKRWRDRGKELEAQQEKRRAKRRQLLGEAGRKQREPARPIGEGGTQKSRRHRKGKAEDTKFDKLVADYKQKLFRREEAGQVLRKSKWFDEG